MRSFNVKPSHLLSVTLLGLALAGSPVQAQENLPAPAGWKKSIIGSDVVFLSQGTPGSYTVKKLAPYRENGSFPSWFNAQVRIDGLKRGRVISSRPLPPNGGVYCVAQDFRSLRGEIQSLFYVGYAVGSMGRLTYFAGPNARLVALHVRNLKPLGQQVAAIDGDKLGRNAPVSRPSRNPLRNDPRDIPIAKPPRM